MKTGEQKQYHRFYYQILRLQQQNKNNFQQNVLRNISLVQPCSCSLPDVGNICRFSIAHLLLLTKLFYCFVRFTVRIIMKSHLKYRISCIIVCSIYFYFIYLNYSKKKTIFKFLYKNLASITILNLGHIGTHSSSVQRCHCTNTKIPLLKSTLLKKVTLYQQ